MRAGKVVWLWQVTGDGQWRGVAGSFGRAQRDAEICMANGGRAAVVESARWVMNPETMQREYAPTGRRCTASRRDGRVHWSELTPTMVQPA